MKALHLTLLMMNSPVRSAGGSQSSDRQPSTPSHAEIHQDVGMKRSPLQWAACSRWPCCQTAHSSALLAASCVRPQGPSGCTPAGFTSSSTLPGRPCEAPGGVAACMAEGLWCRRQHYRCDGPGRELSGRSIKPEAIKPKASKILPSTLAVMARDRPDGHGRRQPLQVLVMDRLAK